MSVLLLPVVLPVLVALAIAIRLESPGPIMFKQQRTGHHGQRFGMYKFRTMVETRRNSRPALRTLISSRRRTSRSSTIRASPGSDGSFARRSLDELPQMLNVLRGDMSLVGPRPTSFAPDTYTLWHTARLEVRPGITGLWQLKGRNASTFDERLRLDVEYINRMSLIYDLKTIALTVVSVLRGSGA